MAYVAEVDSCPIEHETRAAPRFDGIRIRTCTHRRYIISYQNYSAYCPERGLGEALRPTETKVVIGIGGRRKAIGGFRIQIPFMGLCLVIEVNFLVVAEAIPTLLYTKDMVDNRQIYL